MKTPKDLKRRDIKAFMKERLKEDFLEIFPLSISLRESSNEDVTVVDFSFETLLNGERKVHKFENIQGRGFVDATFTRCLELFREDCKSLKNLSLVDLIIEPLFSFSNNTSGSDAKTNVIFRLEVKNHGVSEFRSQSRSIVFSSFSAILEAFQFYINCDSAFKKIKIFLQDAQSRGRFDIAQVYIHDLSKLTEMNSYG